MIYVRPIFMPDATSTSQFWSVNFWGILGSVTGLVGLAISWLTWRYSRPAIKLTKTSLRTRKVDDEFLKENRSKTQEELRNYVIDFHLDIEISNRRGGPGSIEKPHLIFKTKGFPQKEIIDIEPEPGYYKLTKTGDMRTSPEWDYIHEGKAFNLSAGQMLDDTLRYHVSGSGKDLYKLIEFYEQGYFMIRYHTNAGRTKVARVELDASSNF